MEYKEDELYHYGRKGMKWGQSIYGKIHTAKVNRRRKKNLEKARQAKAEAKKQADEVAKKKEDVLKSRSAKELYTNAHLFTQQELQSAYNRLELEKKIKDIAPKEVSKGEQFVNNFAKKADTISKLGTSAMKLYNLSSNMYETFSSKGKKNGWENIRQREAAEARKAAEKQAAEKAAKKASREAEKEAKKAARETEKETKKSSQNEDNKIYVYGKGTSTSDYANKGNKFTKDFDWEVDFTNSPSSSSSSNYTVDISNRIESGANYIAGYLEKIGD